jgi:hypothetical protein
MVHEMDENLDRNDETYKAAVVMLAGLSATQDMPRIERLTGYNHEFVKFVKWNLRKAKIWEKNNTFDLSWCENETFEEQATLFWLYSMVGAGTLELKEGMFRLRKRPLKHEVSACDLQDSHEVP